MIKHTGITTDKETQRKSDPSPAMSPQRKHRNHSAEEDTAVRAQKVQETPPVRACVIKTKRKQGALSCTLSWDPAATYLPGPSPAKYCRRMRA